MPKPPRLPALPFQAARDFLAAQLRTAKRAGADTAGPLLAATDTTTAARLPSTISVPLGGELHFALSAEQQDVAAAYQSERRRMEIEGLAPNSRRGLASDWLNWLGYCLHNGCDVLPSRFADVKVFIDQLVAGSRQKATIEHHTWAIAEINRRYGCPDPMDSQLARDYWRQLSRDKLSGEQNQAKPLNFAAVQAITAHLRDPENVRPGRRASLADQGAVGVAQRRRDLRDAALVNVAYDLMLRSAELVGVRWDRIEADSGGSGAYRVGKTKTDQLGHGKRRYLRPETMADLDAWRGLSGPSPFAFHKVIEYAGDHEPADIPSDVTDTDERERLRWPPLTTQEVGAVFRRAARLAGVPVPHLSGHSTRVGGAQDMVEAGATTDEVQQAGGWKDGRMPAKYAERPLAKRAGEKRFRKLQAQRDRDAPGHTE